MQLIKKPAGPGIETWGGVTLLEEYGESDVIADRTAPVTMRVWVAQDGVLTLKAEDTSGTPDQYGNSTSWLEVDASVTTGWNDVSFDFSNPDRTGADYSADDNYDKLALFPDNGVLPTAGEWVYKIDQVDVPATDLIAAPSNFAPDAAAASYTVATGDIDIFVDAKGSLVSDLDPSWSQTTVLEVVDDPEAGKILKFGSFDYQGIQLSAAQDVSGKEYLHLDVWSDTSGSIDVGLCDTTATGAPGVGEDLTTVTLVGGQWNSVEIDLSSMTNVDLTAVHQVKFANGSGVTEFYVDNLAITAPVTTTPPPS